MTDDCGCESPSDTRVTGLRAAGSTLSRNEFSRRNMLSFSACVCAATDDGQDHFFRPSDMIFEPGALAVFHFWLTLVIVVEAIETVDWGGQER